VIPRGYPLFRIVSGGAMFGSLGGYPLFCVLAGDRVMWGVPLFLLMGRSNVKQRQAMGYRLFCCWGDQVTH
jgi:hypothetical protein